MYKRNVALEGWCIDPETQPKDQIFSSVVLFKLGHKFNAIDRRAISVITVLIFNAHLPPPLSSACPGTPWQGLSL